LPRVLAERLRERDQRLVAVLDLLRVDAADLREQTGALRAAFRALAALEQGFDELVELPEPAPHVFQPAESDAIVAIELDELRVDRLGRGQAFGAGGKHAGGAEQQRFLGGTLLGRHACRGVDERLRDAVRGALGGRLQLHRQGLVARLGEQAHEQRLDLLARHGRHDADRLARAIEEREHGGGVRRALVGVLVEQTQEQRVDLRRDEALGRDAARRDGRAREVAERRVERAALAEHRQARDQLESHGAERIHVAARIRAEPADLLRRGRLGRGGGREQLGALVADARAHAQPIGAGVEQHDRERAFGGPQRHHVFES
jgi:hypothetical protein